MPTFDWTETVIPAVNPAKVKKKRPSNLNKTGVHKTVGGKGIVARIPKK